MFARTLVRKDPALPQYSFRGSEHGKLPAIAVATREATSSEMAFTPYCPLNIRPRKQSFPMNSTPVCAQSKPNPDIAANMTNKASTTPALTNNKPPGFCRNCASELEYQVPAGDHRTRLVCSGCGAILYENPKVVVACVPISSDLRRVLLGRRAIAPQGKWTIPAGFLESGETAHQGAEREALEEMGAVLDMNPINLLAMYNVLPANQVQLVYRCTLLNERDIAPGPEMEEVRMFEWTNIPWDELAFPTVKWALQYSLENLHNAQMQPQMKSR